MTPNPIDLLSRVPSESHWVPRPRETQTRSQRYEVLSLLLLVLLLLSFSFFFFSFDFFFCFSLVSLIQFPNRNALSIDSESAEYTSYLGGYLLSLSLSHTHTLLSSFLCICVLFLISDIFVFSLLNGSRRVRRGHWILYTCTQSTILSLSPSLSLFHFSFISLISLILCPSLVGISACLLVLTRISLLCHRNDQDKGSFLSLLLVSPFSIFSLMTSWQRSTFNMDVTLNPYFKEGWCKVTSRGSWIRVFLNIFLLRLGMMDLDLTLLF